MKCTVAAFAALFLITTVHASGVEVARHSPDRPITQVVKLLQDMLDKSKAEGDEERVIYAKFKCYCDTSEEEKKKSIEELTAEISLLESAISALQARNGELSTDVAELDKAMADNVAARDEATEIRTKANAEYNATVADLDQAIEQLTDAINVLAQQGADQSDPDATGADHKYFMANFKPGAAMVQQRRSRLEMALAAARPYMTEKQLGTVSAFVQAPFTGTYTSQSVEVIGILKNMRDRFSADLKAADATEAAEVEAYEKFMKTKIEAYEDMSASYDEKQGELGDNDGELEAKRISLNQAETQKAEDEEFLASLIPMCKEKTQQYEARKLMRANEQAALAEAIAILNSDASFETFGTVTATSGKPSFLQLASINRHEPAAARDQILALLQGAAKGTRSARLEKIAAMVQVEDPFAIVLAEIDKMLQLIQEEATQDKTDLEWCKKEREVNKKKLKELKAEILRLTGEIQQLYEEINHPKTGLKAMIEATETSLKENHDSQVAETTTRTEENVAYQKDIANLVEAEDLIARALKVLRAYYDDLANKLESAPPTFIQEEPAPPPTWDAYKGQSADGSSAIDMLEFILNETKLEEKTAHEDEESSQHAYEDSMQTLKDEEARLEESLAKLKKTLAEKEKELLETTEDKKATVAEAQAVEDYLRQIKPGCDFITTNFDLREANRETETDALKKAAQLIKATPAYKEVQLKKKIQDFGQCKEKCVDDEEGVVCKACLARVSIPGYCAGHPDTIGCETAAAPAPAVP